MGLARESGTSLIKCGIASLVVVSCLTFNTLKVNVNATQISSSHIGTFGGSTTFTTTSESEVTPEIFVEVMDKKGNLTQYESESGHLTIPNTHEGTYITQAKLLGKTKYKDIDTLNEKTHFILDSLKQDYKKSQD